MLIVNVSWHYELNVPHNSLSIIYNIMNGKVSEATGASANFCYFVDLPFAFESLKSLYLLCSYGLFLQYGDCFLPFL